MASTIVVEDLLRRGLMVEIVPQIKIRGKKYRAVSACQNQARAASGVFTAGLVKVSALTVRGS